MMNATVFRRYLSSSLNFSEEGCGLTRKNSVYIGILIGLSFASQALASKEESSPLQQTDGDFHEA
jgi:hypothetical protein